MKQHFLYKGLKQLSFHYFLHTIADCKRVLAQEEHNLSRHSLTVKPHFQQASGSHDTKDPASRRPQQEPSERQKETGEGRTQEPTESEYLAPLESRLKSHERQNIHDQPTSKSLQATPVYTSVGPHDAGQPPNYLAPQPPSYDQQRSLPGIGRGQRRVWNSSNSNSSTCKPCELTIPMN